MRRECKDDLSDLTYNYMKGIHRGTSTIRLDIRVVPLLHRPSPVLLLSLELHGDSASKNQYKSKQDEKMASRKTQKGLYI